MPKRWVATIAIFSLLLGLVIGAMTSGWFWMRIQTDANEAKLIFDVQTRVAVLKQLDPAKSAKEIALLEQLLDGDILGLDALLSSSENKDELSKALGIAADYRKTTAYSSAESGVAKQVQHILARAYEANSCAKGGGEVRAGSYENSIELLGQCINSHHSDNQVKARAYEMRAWAHHSLRNDVNAVEDQEAAFKIKPASEHRQYINYALYLRKVGRFKDSLAALHSAEALDVKQGYVSMMTQYHLGWTLSELKDYEKAIQAFTKGIPQQKDYPFAYWRRGLAFEALDRKNEARQDFAKAGALISADKNRWPENEVADIREKLRQYGLEKEYVF